MLLPVIGLSDWDVSATARAITAQIGTVPSGVLLPIAVDPRDAPNTFQPGETHILSLGDDAPGQFSWLTWDGDHDSGTLAANLCTPQNPAMDLTDADPSDDWIEGDVGKTNSERRARLPGPIQGPVVLLPTYDTTQLAGLQRRIPYHRLHLLAPAGLRGQPGHRQSEGKLRRLRPRAGRDELLRPAVQRSSRQRLRQYSFFLGLVE